jgi:hypothetical protein
VLVLAPALLIGSALDGGTWLGAAVLSIWILVPGLALLSAAATYGRAWSTRVPA